MSSRPYDVAIAGGGPAGCAAALRLARAGARVALCEAHTYPHEKVCGEFLSPECAALLAGLGLDGLLASLGAARIETVSVAAPQGAAWEDRFPAPGWGLSRAALDAALAERAAAAGVDVRAGTRVERVTGDLGAGFVLQTRCGGQDVPVAARAFIAAHGKRSNLDRALDRRFLLRREPYVALKAHFNAPPPGAPPQGGPRLGGRIDLAAFPGGYYGLSENETGATNLALLVREDVFRRAGASGMPGADGAVTRQSPAPRSIDNFLAWLRRQSPLLDGWLEQAAGPGAEAYGAASGDSGLDDSGSGARPLDPGSAGRWLSIAQVPFSPKEPALGDILLVGDAAGVVAPLAGDGIAMALRSGSLAAGLVLRYLEGALLGRALPVRYAASWRREFGPRLLLGRALQPLLMDPRAATAAVRLIRLFPLAGRALMHGTRDLSLLRGGETAFAKENFA